MIDVTEATQIILGTAHDFGGEEVPLHNGIARVLKEDWYCDRDLPPYDRVTMDGIAINYDGALGQDTLKIEGVIAAGNPQGQLVNPSKCVEIMTGASMPKGADTVIRYEDLTIQDGAARINMPIRKNQNIHWKGEDRKSGELLVPTGTLLSASEIGVGASIGKSTIMVSKLPKCIIISTGDELVEVNETPKDHQIRRGNVYRMQATLQHIGLQVDTAHLKDNMEAIVSKLKEYLDQYELILMSGGVSKGKFDYLPEALDQCGVKKLFHRVAQRPGKPLWFGTHANGTTVFALPGNPVSSFMCLNIYVTDWIRSCIGLAPNVRPMASLAADVYFKPDLTYFLEVSLTYNDKGKIIAQPQKGNGSGDLANLINGDAFIRLPRGKDLFQKDEVYPIYKYR